MMRSVGSEKSSGRTTGITSMIRSGSMSKAPIVVRSASRLCGGAARRGTGIPDNYWGVGVKSGLRKRLSGLSPTSMLVVGLSSPASDSAQDAQYAATAYFSGRGTREGSGTLNSHDFGYPRSK